MFLRQCLAVVVVSLIGESLVGIGSAARPADADSRYFPRGILHATWQEFPVAGYSQPVTGVVYRGNPRPACGMPLGGLDTGCLDIESNGLLGYGTIFNALVHPRELYNAPFAGLSVGGKTWMLATDGKGKKYRPVERTTAVFPPVDYTPSYVDIGLKDVEFAKSIDYFGHYPVLDMEFDTDAPVSVGLRAWSPMLPGNVEASLMPAMVFEFSLRNPSHVEQTGTLAFSFPGFGSKPKSTIQIKRINDKDAKLNGVEVATTDEGTPLEMSYVLAAIDAENVRTGGAINCDGASWSAVHKKLPEESEKGGATLAIDFQLKPGEAQVRRIVLAWHAPYWNAGGSPQASEGRVFKHMYAKHYKSALATAEQMAASHEALLARVIAWQQVLYDDTRLPGWLADALINNLHLITETSVWGQSDGPLSTFKPEMGLFALNECPRGCAQLECIPCSFYGNMPIVYFYPEAALSTLRGYKEYQFEDGRPPWIFGGVTAGIKENQAPYDLAAPDKGYQSVLNAAAYIVMFDRYWQTTRDDQVLAEFYDSLKRANDFSLNLRPKFGLSQVMAMPEPGTDTGGLGDTEWFEAPEPGWKGYVTHAGGVRMAQVQLMKRIAEAMGDVAYVGKCDAWLEAGSKVLNEKLWAGSYYLNFNDPETNAKSDLIFGYQLDGEWICDSHGVPGVFPPDKVELTLNTIRNANCMLSQSGATNYANPDGSAAAVGGYGTYGYFTPELMMLAMTYMYEGQYEFGEDLLRRSLENTTCQWGYTWDAPNTIRGDMDTGQRHFGADYYQNMMLWFAPAAIAGEDMVGPTKEGGLVSRVIRAARGDE